MGGITAFALHDANLGKTARSKHGETASDNFAGFVPR